MQIKHINTNKFNKCGIYQLICQDFNMKYIGQTGRPFSVRFKEHFHDLKYKKWEIKICTICGREQSIHCPCGGHDGNPVGNKEGWNDEYF